MKNNKLWTLWNSIPKSEKNYFLRWHAAEWGDRQWYQQQLAVNMADFDVAPDRHEMWQLLYPGVIYNDGRFRKLCRDVLASLEDFLAIQAFRQSPMQRDIYLLQYLKSNADPDLFIHTYKRTERKLEEIRIKGVHEAYVANAMERMKQEFLLGHPRLRSEFALLDREAPFSSLEARFDTWVSLEVLSYSMIRKSYLLAGNDVPDSHFAQPALNFIQEAPSTNEYSMVSVFRGMLEILDQGKRLTMEELIALISNIRELVNEDSAVMLHRLMLNHIGSFYNKQNTPDLARQMIAVYVWGIEDGILDEGGFLTNINYRNFILLCLNIREFETAFKYLNELRLRLAPEFSEEEYNLGLARYGMAVEDYATVIKAITGTRFQEVQTQVQAQIMLIQAHYERDPEDVQWLSGMIRQSIRFSRSQASIKPELNKTIQEMLRLMNRFIFAVQKTDVRRLKAKCQALSNSRFRQWMEEKMDQKLNDM